MMRLSSGEAFDVTRRDAGMAASDHAEREHGNREIVAARPDGSTVRTNWTELADVARRMGRA
ncbi:MAG TPA: hypothetical protein VHU79_09870, partial [Sphingomicrobium sp.]|nr:hypothetical protein [Sphingomicrobium sp.]